MTPVRTLVVWCPDWPVTAAGFSPGGAVAVLFANRLFFKTGRTSVSKKLTAFC